MSSLSPSCPTPPDAAQIEGGRRRRGAGSRRGPLHLDSPPHRGRCFRTGRQGRRPRSSTSSSPPAQSRVSCPNPRSNLTPTGSAVLKAAPGDEDAVRCKVVAYIKADEIDKAFAAIRAAERLPIDLSYYKVTRPVLTCSCSPDGSVRSLCCHLAH